MENLDISCRTHSNDWALFVAVVNQGIDSYLEAFTLSTFTQKDGRLFMSIHPDEISIFIRRLCELAEDESYEDNAYQWVSDVIYAQYDIEGITP